MTNILSLKHHEGSVYTIEYRWTLHRYLLSNGDTIDVWAVNDDSWVRDAVLMTVNNITTRPKDHKYDIIIVGSAIVRREPELEPPKPKKKAAPRVTTDEASESSAPDESSGDHDPE